MPSSSSSSQHYPLTAAVDAAIDAAVAVKDTLNTVQVIEYRQRMLMERLVTLSHAYADMCRIAAKNTAVVVTRHHAVANASNTAAATDSDDVLILGEVAASAGVSVSGAAAHAPASIVPGLVDAFSPLAVASASATSGVMGGHDAITNTGADPSSSLLPFLAPTSGGTSPSTKASRSGATSASAAKHHNQAQQQHQLHAQQAVAAMAPIAQQLAELRGAIKAIEDELEVLGATRVALVGAIAVA